MLRISAIHLLALKPQNAQTPAPPNAQNSTRVVVNDGTGGVQKSFKKKDVGKSKKLAHYRMKQPSQFVASLFIHFNSIHQIDDI